MTALIAASFLAIGFQGQGQVTPPVAIGVGEPALKRTMPTIYDFKMKDIDGKWVPLKTYQGKVLLIVNVASQCGFTPQYEALQALYTQKKDQGLVILGFPANNFKAQEPGTDAEIKTFCTSKYGVTFPMFSKISVLGDDMSPLYKYLLENNPNHADIEWNFAKFVVDRHGKIVGRFSPKDTPLSEPVVSAIDAALAEKADE